LKNKYFYISILSAILMSCSNEKPLTDANNATADSPKGNTENAAIIEFDEIEKKLPNIQEGEQVTILYNYTNAGKSPLIVTKAEGSCGCTSVTFSPNRPLDPGEKGFIRAIFNSSGKPKNQTKLITVYSNDPKEKKILNFTVYVEPQYKEDNK